MPPHARPLPFSDLSAMVIDDSQYMRLLTRSMLSRFGVVEILEAVDGAEALDRLVGHTVDLILVDYAMDPLNGVEFTKLLRRDKAHPSRKAPIVMMTGFAGPELVMAARDAGVSEMLVKPLVERDVFAKCRMAVESPRPFVDVPSYAGPCRRRRFEPVTACRRRRDMAEAAGQASLLELRISRLSAKLQRKRAPANAAALQKLLAQLTDLLAEQRLAAAELAKQSGTGGEPNRKRAADGVPGAG